MTAAASQPAPAGRPRFRRLTVSRVERLCEDAVAITFDVPAGLAEEFRFRPGQWLTVRRVLEGRDQRRSYSVCAPAGAAPRIAVREITGGAVSGWLVREVRPGDRIEVQAPAGSFTPDLTVPARHVLIAAGSGITPILSITASVLRHPGSEAAILYGNRRSDSVMFADELADLKDAYPTRLQLLHVLSREPQHAEVLSGRIDAAKLRRTLPAACAIDAVDHWWLCGPFGMIADALAVLAEFGVPRERIHRELFYAGDLPPPSRHDESGPAAPGSDVTIILDGRATTIAIARGTAILDGAQWARPDLPFACRGGVCGTCRARVVTGQVRMRRNFALDPSETAAGFVLTCQSLPVSGEVTVSYDT